MSCILRYSGKNLKVKSLVNAVSMEPDRIWLRGSEHEDSGVTFLASNADFSEFDKQVEEATSYLKAHREDLLLIADSEAIEYRRLDFGVALRSFVHNDILTPQFLASVSGLNIEVEISHYPCEDEE